MFHVSHLGGWTTADAATLASVLGVHALVPMAIWLAARHVRSELV
jgi:hypothetical protein